MQLGNSVSNKVWSSTIEEKELQGPEDNIYSEQKQTSDIQQPEQTLDLDQL